MISLGILNTMAPLFRQYLKYWGNEASISSTKVTLGIFEMCKFCTKCCAKFWGCETVVLLRSLISCPCNSAVMLLCTCVITEPILHCWLTFLLAYKRSKDEHCVAGLFLLGRANRNKLVLIMTYIYLWWHVIFSTSGQCFLTWLYVVSTSPQYKAIYALYRRWTPPPPHLNWNRHLWFMN